MPALRVAKKSALDTLLGATHTGLIEQKSHFSCTRCGFDGSASLEPPYPTIPHCATTVGLRAWTWVRPNGFRWLQPTGVRGSLPIAQESTMILAQVPPDSRGLGFFFCIPPSGGILAFRRRRPLPLTLSSTLHVRLSATDPPIMLTNSPRRWGLQLTALALVILLKKLGKWQRS